MGLTQKPWVNFIGFQVYWWSCILLQNYAFFICAVLLSLHLYYHSNARQEFKSLVVLGIAGFSVDFILALFDWFQFNSEPAYIPPFWLLLLWFGFATNVTTLSNMFNKKWYVMAFAGATLAPLSYLAAAKLGAVSLPAGYLYTWLALVPVWFLLLPSLFFSQYKIEDTYAEA